MLVGLDACVHAVEQHARGSGYCTQLLGGDTVPCTARSQARVHGFGRDLRCVLIGELTAEQSN